MATVKGANDKSSAVFPGCGDDVPPGLSRPLPREETPMSQWNNKANRRKTRTRVPQRPKFWRPRLAILALEDRVVPTTFTSTNAGAILIPGDQVNGAGSASPY